MQAGPIPASLTPTAEAAPAASAAPTAPTPVVSANHLLDSRSGAVWIPRGVNWPSFEYACAQGWGYSRDSANAATAAAIASWEANTVRLPLNQDCWLGTNGSPAGPARSAAGYRAAVQSFVGQLNAAGLVVILDLHSSTTSFETAGQRAMPDAASLLFWASVAALFRSNHSVMFDAYNEPYSRAPFQLTWSCWRSGGCQAPIEDDYTDTLSGKTYTVAGMASVVAAIRGAGAAQPILLGGLDYSNDLTGWLAGRPTDGQLVASFHNYTGQHCSTAACWDSTIAPVAAAVPVITGEFGEDDPTADFINSYMTWADAHGIGYLPWAWWTDPSQALALLSDDDGTPRAPLGTAFKAHLLALSGQAPPAPPAPSPPPPVPPVPSPPAPSPPPPPPPPPVPSPPATPAAGGFVPVTPARLFDTRSAHGAVAAGGTLSVQIAGRAGVPAAVSAVAVNVTVTAPTAAGHLTVYPSGAPRPVASILNFIPRQTTAGLAVLPIGADGKILLYNGSHGSSQLIVDVAGYFRAGTPSAAGTFVPVVPARLLDTRTGLGAAMGPVAAHGSVNLRIGGRAHVPAAGVSAAAMTVTVTAPTAPGFLTVFTGALPGTSNLGFRAGQTVPNFAIAPTTASGTTRLYNGSAGRSQLLADVSGYFLAGTPVVPGAFRALTPARLLDSRVHNGSAGPIGPGGTLPVRITGVAGVPTTGVAAVALVVTVTAPTSVGFLTAFPSGRTRPDSSTLNFLAGRTVANAVVVPVGPNGKIDLYNGSSGSTPVIADVQGYYLS